MKILLLTSLICFVFLGSYGQTPKVAVKEKTDRPVYNAVEEQPEPVGGIDKLLALIAKNTKYPSGCEDIGSRIIISFIVEADGSTDNYVVVKDPCGNKHLLADQVFKMVNDVKWIPGKMNGKPVATRYSLPLTICLGSDD